MQPSDEQNSHELEELASMLNALEDGGCYRVERTLKDTGYETTQVVYRTGECEAGPFIRKTFALDSGCGQAYASIYRAQVAGGRFAHQPIIYDCVQADDRLTVVMEYVHGETLSQLVRREGPSEALAVRVGIMLCDALAELHEKVNPPIIHRDVKPSNIMLTDGRLVLVDLGIAREARPDARRDTVRFGTPGYAPPEQFGYGQTSVRSDVYAAGMAIAFCLTGQDDNEALRDRGFRDVDASPAIRKILAKATEFDPKMRYASAKDMGACLWEIATPDSSEAFLRGSTPSVSDEAVLPAASKNTSFKTWLKRIWNGVIVVVWAILFVIALYVVIYPAGEVEHYSLWFRAIAYLFMVVVPSACIGYLLMFKRDIRQHVQFLSRLTWKAEIPICIAGGVVSMLLAVIIGAISGQLT